MKTISFIDQPKIVKQRLQHLGLWEMPPPKIKLPPSDYADEHIPSYDYADPDYAFEAYM